MGPADVAVDKKNGKMFVAAEGCDDVSGYVGMFDLDGNNEKVFAGPGMVRPYGLCLDDVHQHVFVIQGGHGGNVNCHAYGSTPCPKKIVQPLLEYAYMCTVDNTWAPYGGPSMLIFSQANRPGQIYF